MAWSTSSTLKPRRVAGSASAISNLSWPLKNEDEKRSAAPGFEARNFQKTSGRAPPGIPSRLRGRSLKRLMVEKICRGRPNGLASLAGHRRGRRAGDPRSVAQKGIYASLDHAATSRSTLRWETDAWPPLHGERSHGACTHSSTADAAVWRSGATAPRAPTHRESVRKQTRPKPTCAERSH